MNAEEAHTSRHMPIGGDRLLLFPKPPIAKGCSKSPCGLAFAGRPDKSLLGRIGKFHAGNGSRKAVSTVVGGGVAVEPFRFNRRPGRKRDDIGRRANFDHHPRRRSLVEGFQDSGDRRQGGLVSGKKIPLRVTEPSTARPGRSDDVAGSCVSCPPAGWAVAIVHDEFDGNRAVCRIDGTDRVGTPNRRDIG
jgi:hypothetical protein